MKVKQDIKELLPKLYKVQNYISRMNIFLQKLEIILLSDFSDEYKIVAIEYFYNELERECVI